MITIKLHETMEEGTTKADTTETGKVVDMIKDLDEAAEKAYKALYYKELIAAMKGKEYGRDYTEEGPVYRNAHEYHKALENYKNGVSIEDKENSLSEYMDIITAEIEEMLPGMSLNTKQMLKNRLQMIQNTI